MKDKHDKELSPCIVSKAKFALGLKGNKPNNNKICSRDYWERVINRFGELKIVTDQEVISAAINKYDDLIGS